MIKENAAQDLIDMVIICKELIGDDMPNNIQDAADDALRSLIKSMAILGYNLVTGPVATDRDGDNNDNYR